TALSVTGGGQHQWSVDGSGDPSSWTDPASATATVTRDGNGNVSVSVDRKGQRVEITRGAGDRITQVVYKRANGTVESTVTYSYDPNTDLLSSISDSAAPGPVSFLYNSLDECTQISGPEGSTVFTYDNLGRLGSAQAPGQTPVLYGYDSYGRLASISKGTQALTYQWDNPTGRLISITRPHGIVTNAFRDLPEQADR